MNKNFDRTKIGNGFLVSDADLDVKTALYPPNFDDADPLSIGNNDPDKVGAIASKIVDGITQLFVYQGDGTWLKMQSGDEASPVLKLWQSGDSIKQNKYVTHTIGDNEYLFRSEIDGNTSEPSLEGDSIPAWIDLEHEGLPGFWNSSNNFSIGDFARFSGDDVYVYQSKTNGNVNNEPIPLVSDVNWEYIGISRSFHDSGTTYNLNDVVLGVFADGVEFNNKLFKSNLASNNNALGATILAPGSWALVGIKPLDYTAENIANKATDFITSNDILYPSVKAVKTYADALVYGLLNDRGNWDASGNTFPNTGGSGTSGAILKGNLWYISVAGTLGGQAVNIGDWVRALVDSPAQTSANWSIAESNLGFVPERESNKQDSLDTDGTGVKYPTVDAVNTALSGKIYKQTRIIYADDYIDSYTGIDPTTGRNLGSAIYNGLEALNLLGGGTLMLSNKTYYPVGGDIFSPLVYENMFIKGAKMPYFNSDATGLLEGSGTIILGSLCFITPGGQALKISNLGIDVGKNVCDTYYGGDATDGLCWAKPTDHNPISPYTENAYAENITVIAKDVSSLCHAFLFEGINGGFANNILTMYGFHGIVNKSKNTTLTNLKAYFHGGEGFIIKSDDYAISENVFAENIDIDNIIAPQGVTPYNTDTCTYGVLIHASTASVGNLRIGSVQINGATDGVSMFGEGGNNISIVDINSINANDCVNALTYSGTMYLSRSRVGNIIAINSSGYVVYSSIPSIIQDNNTIGVIKTAVSPTHTKPIGVKLVNESSLSIESARWQNIQTGYDIGSGSNLYINEEFNGFITKLVSSTKEPLYNTVSNNFDEKLNVTLKSEANATVLKSGSNSDYGWLIEQDELSTGDWYLKSNIDNTHYNNISVSRSTGLVSIYNGLISTQYKLSALNAAPSSSTDTGTTGDIRITATYIYVCVATNTWVRSELTTW